MAIFNSYVSLPEGKLKTFARITLAPSWGKDGQGALVDLQSLAVKDMVMWGCPWCFRRSPWMFWTKDDQIKTAIESA